MYIRERQEEVNLNLSGLAVCGNGSETALGNGEDFSSHELSFRTS